jgi:hypothetical protein
VVSDVAASSITRSSATISWTTNEPASSQVDYGPADVTTNHSDPDPSLVSAHRVVLTGLQAGLPYRYRVRSIAADGGQVISVESVMVTAPAGSGPEIVNVAAQRVTGTSSTVGWATSTGNVVQVEYGTTANYGLFTLLQVLSGSQQQLTLTGLHPATTYHFRVKGWDASGALGASGDATFTTAPSGTATLIGDQTLQADTVTQVSGQAVAFQYTASVSGQASVARVFVDVGSTTPNLRVALYSDQNGTPGAILSQSSAPASAPGWISINLPPVPLLQGTRYWVAVLSPLGAGNLNLREATSGGSSAMSAQNSLAAFAATWATGIVGAKSPLSFYVQQVPPAVTMTGPADGTTITGAATLSALVDDDAPLTSLQFAIDGAPVGTPLLAAPYTLTWDVSTLNPNVPHTISARATDAQGRTGTSGLVTVQVDNGPLISTVAMSPGLTATSAQITWTTSTPADGQVEFGTTTAYGALTPVDGQATTRHELQLTGLLPATAYHYHVRSRDASGALAVSADQTFVTPPQP